jgi:dimethylhistidine N-methyltransferase
MNEFPLTAPSAMMDEVLAGLQKPQKSLPSKLFYDERGSRLFEQITTLPEYYPTRTEYKIIREHINKIAEEIGPDSVIIEPGSGSCEKVRLLLDNLSDVKAYVPVDISQQYLANVVRELRADYPALRVKPVCADYTRPFSLPEIDQPFEYYVVFYPGSTIGNFQPDEAQNFLEMLSEFMVPGGGLLIGVDLKKDKRILEAAYNDSAGITAAFNKNMLERLNRELNADFALEKFEHRAFYNEKKGRVEMHLASLAGQTIHIGGEAIHFNQQETIHTENSYKYSPEDFKSLVNDWFEVKNMWTDDNNLFSLQYLVKR